MNQILSGVPVESLCLTSGILLSAKSYDTPIRIWQMLSNENARLVDLSDVMFGLTVYVHSELDTSRQMCARDKLIAKESCRS